MKQNAEWKGKYKSELLMVCHMDVQAMYKIGVISEKEMEEYDHDCLLSPPKPTSEGKGIRKQKPAIVYAGSG